MAKAIIDTEVIQGELEGLAGGFKVKVTAKKTGAGALVRQTDSRFEVNLNPELIRTAKQLQGHLDWIRRFIAA